MDGHQDEGARTGQVVESVRVTSAGTVTGHDRVAVSAGCGQQHRLLHAGRPMPLDKHEWDTNYICTESTAVPPYPRVIRYKPYRGHVKPRIIPNAIYNVIFV
jgi:hypothetical protein